MRILDSIYGPADGSARGWKRLAIMSTIAMVYFAVAAWAFSGWLLILVFLNLAHAEFAYERWRALEKAP